MAVEQTQVLPAPVLEAALTAFTQKLPPLMGQQINTAAYDPKVAAQTSLQTGASQAAQGLGSLVGPDAYQPFMSPYQQEVMDTTLAEFDRQQAINQTGLRDQAIGAGAYGGARQGIMQQQFMNQGAVDRAQLQAQLLNQGFMQAQQAAGADLAARQGLGQYQQALGQADQGFEQAKLDANYTCSKRSRVRTIYKIRFSWTTTSTNTTRRISDYNDRVSTKRSTSKSNG
jgi:hypothetical protein